MSSLRRLALAVGVVLVLGGLAVVVAPGLAGGVGLSSGLVGIVGALALLAGLAGVRTRLNADAREADLPEPERRVATAVPGTDVDTRLETLSTRTSRGLGTRRTLRERIRSAAMDVLTSEGYTETDAEAALAAGTWTDDPYAAAFFAGGRSDLPLWIRVRSALGDGSAMGTQARHAIDALADRSETGEARDATGDGELTDDGLTDADRRPRDRHGGGDASGDRDDATWRGRTGRNGRADRNDRTDDRADRGARP